MKSLSEDYDRAISLHKEGDFEEAYSIYLNLLQVNYNHHVSYLTGVVLSDLGRYEEALKYFRQFLEWEPGHEHCRLAFGESLLILNQTDAAFQQFKKILEVNSSSLEACVGIARVYEMNKSWEELEAFSSAVAEKFPDDEDVLRLLIRAKKEKREFGEAILLCVKFIKENKLTESTKAWFEELFKFIRKPSRELMDLIRSIDLPQAKVLAVRVFIRAGEVEDAKALYEENSEELERSVGVNALTMGNLLKNEKFHIDAEPYFKKYLKVHYEDTNALSAYIDNCLTMAKQHPEKFREAKELTEYWLSRKPNDRSAISAMGGLHMSTSRPELSLPYWDKLVKKNPLHPIATSRLFCRNYDERLSPEEIYQSLVDWGTLYEKDKVPDRKVFYVKPESDKRLRIGYLSPDFGMHPVGFFFIDILKAHDFSAFDVFMYSNRFADEGDDRLSKEFRKHVGASNWRWTRGMKTKDLVNLIKEDKIDILVEMAGHTSHNRLDVIPYRAAPIQVEWLGYPNSTGLTSMDYRFSDAVTEPPGVADQRSTEIIYRLPNGFHSFHIDAELPDVSEAPCLKNGYITFGTYNNMNKLGSASIALWSELLKCVKGSRILIKHGTLSILDNRESLYSNFAMHGIPKWRIILKEAVPSHIAHLDSYKEIDIALDPIAYNGTTTTCDALSMGVPVLTRAGETHASRVSSSLLHRVGLDEWIAGDDEEFLKIGRHAAQNPRYLSELRNHIREKFRASPLQDGKSIAQDLEHAFIDIWGQLCLKQEGNPFIVIKS